MSRVVHEEAVRLKTALEKALSSDSRQEVLDILGAIELLKVTEALVNETKIGKAVKGVTSKYGKTDELTKKSQSILKEWTRIAKEEGKKVTKGADKAGGGEAKANPVKAAAPAINVEREVEGYSETRLKIFRLFVESLTGQNGASTASVQETAFLIEKALEKAFPSLGKDYVPRARTLLINMKKNAPLRSAVASRALTPEELVVKPISELGNEEFLKRREIMLQVEFESKRLDWDAANAEEIKKSLGVDPNNEWIYDDESGSEDGFD